MNFELGSSTVSVERPFPVMELPRLWQWCVSFRHQTMDDFSPQTEDAFVEFYVSAIQNGMQTYAVYRELDGVKELGGFICFRFNNPFNANVHVLFKRQFFGRQTTIPAIMQALLDFFTFSEVDKLTVNIFSDNHQVRALAKEIGFREEGRISRSTRRRGQPIDTIILGITREEFQKVCLSQQQSHLSAQASEQSAEPLATEAGSLKTLTSVS